MSAARNYLTEDNSIRSWFFTTDHKRVAILYFVGITLFFFIGGAAATLIRLELIEPHGHLVTSDTYNRLFTMHGIIMVWFFLIPSIPSTLGNFIVPLMIGARDLAFPRLNLTSWYLFMAGGATTLYAIFRGGIDTGWTFYAPFSTMYSNSHVVLAVTGVFIAGFSSILTGLNFIVTIHRLRAPGLTWYRLPLFLWSLYATSVILVLATPVLAITLLLVSLDRLFGIGIFDPARGGDPLLFQHLFWFYSHPAVYIMILPGMGVVSELIACYSRKEIFGYKFVAWSAIAIAGVGFFVWGHHMFVSGQSPFAGLVFSFMSFIVAVPSAIKVFNWTATMHKGWIRYDAPMLYALGFIGLFTVGGLTGLFLACLAYDVYVTDTYFVVAHFHYIMVGGMVTAYFGGLHYWWPKITGTALSRVLGARGGNPDLFRIQYDVLSAIHSRRSRHAPALPRLSTGVSDLARHVLGRRLGTRSRLRIAVVLSRLVVVLRRARIGEPLARHGPRVADTVTPAQTQFRKDPRGETKALRLHGQGQSASAKCLSRSPHFNLSTCASNTTWRNSAFGFFWRPRFCFSVV